MKLKSWKRARSAHTMTKALAPAMIKNLSAALMQKRKMVIK